MAGPHAKRPMPPGGRRLEPWEFGLPTTIAGTHETLPIEGELGASHLLAVCRPPGVLTEAKLSRWRCDESQFRKIVFSGLPSTRFNILIYLVSRGCSSDDARDCWHREKPANSHLQQ